MRGAAQGAGARLPHHVRLSPATPARPAAPRTRGGARSSGLAFAFVCSKALVSFFQTVVLSGELCGVTFRMGK